MKLIVRILLALVLSAPAYAARADKAGVFDFYVLSLSWSPSWCAVNPDRRDTRQCDPRNDFGFIVHGLWPQYERGFPDHCPTRYSDRVPDRLGRRYLDITPSMGLIGHEWRKHGTCSGLDQAGYLEKVREAYEQVRIPPALQTLSSGRSASPEAIEKAFMAANPTLSKDAIAVTCTNGRIDEVRLCFSKDLKFRACREVDRQSCRLKSVNIPPIP